MDDAGKMLMRPIEIDKIDEEHGAARSDPTEEVLFYRAVASGAIHLVQDNCSRGVFEDTERMGHLSDDPVRNLKYHFVVTAAMLARFCAEGGMPVNEAFALSDHYIQKMDRSGNLAEVVLLHDQMALDYTGRMRSLKKLAASSKQVTETIDYIYAHLGERITVDELAKAINISPTYLSRIFKQEVGVSVSEYIRQRKIDAAKNLLCYSRYELADIANMLSYSSQSHFIQQFRAAVGMTPKAYRDRNFMNNWDANREPS